MPHPEPFAYLATSCDPHKVSQGNRLRRDVHDERARHYAVGDGPVPRPPDAFGDDAGYFGL